MSDEEREWRFYVEDMLGFGERAVSFTDGFDLDSFIADVRTYDATLRNVELMGEAATHIPDEVRAAHPDIPWREGHRSPEPAGARLSTHQRQRDLVDPPGRNPRPDAQVASPAGRPPRQSIAGKCAQALLSALLRDLMTSPAKLNEFHAAEDPAPAAAGAFGVDVRPARGRWRRIGGTTARSC